ncbi:MAG TPA: hypothetical protein VKI99_20460 [Candidatus Dormibacteraeota bacterium]|nr:hypothetical protein [Candidatus Dormibacteraeota bacterium]
MRSMGLIELAALPVRLSPGQARLLLIVAAAIAVALLVGGVLEAMFGGVVGTILRLTGHPPPRKSSFSTALDELDARLRRKDK